MEKVVDAVSVGEPVEQALDGQARSPEHGSAVHNARVAVDGGAHARARIFQEGGDGLRAAYRRKIFQEGVQAPPAAETAEQVFDGDVRPRELGCAFDDGDAALGVFGGGGGFG